MRAWLSTIAMIIIFPVTGNTQPKGVISSIDSSGIMTLLGYQSGTTVNVEWASSLIDPNRANWYQLTDVIITNFDTSTEWPLYLRARGIPDTNLLAGLVAHYEFSGNTLDSSPYAFHANNYGGQFGSDRFGTPNSAILLDGIDQFVRGPTNVAMTISNFPFTVAAWINPTQTVPDGDYRFVIDQRSTDFETGDGWGVNISGNNGNYAYAFVATGMPGEVTVIATNIGVGNWRHICAVWQTNTLDIYIDGRINNSTIHNGTRFSNTAFLTMGRRWTNERHFPGYIDDVRVYSRPLTSNEIWNLARLPY